MILVSFWKILVSKKVSVSVSKIYGIEKSIGFKKFGIEKVSDSENTFEETRNHLKNIYIKGWRCLFLPIRKSSQKYQRVAVLFLLMTGNPLKNIKGWRCLFEKRDEIDDDD